SGGSFPCQAVRHLRAASSDCKRCRRWHQASTRNSASFSRCSSLRQGMHRRDRYQVIVAGRTLAACSLALGMLLGASARGEQQSFSLPDRLATGTCQQVQVTMDVTGVLRVMNQGQIDELKLAVTADHQYRENVLARGKTRKLARWYDRAVADLVINGEKIQPRLRPQQHLVVIEASSQQRNIYCPGQGLT